VVPTAGLDRCKKSRPHRDSIPGTSSPWSVAIPNELSWSIVISTVLYNIRYGGKGTEKEFKNRNISLNDAAIREIIN
jgi:hypothetical protein